MDEKLMEIKKSICIWVEGVDCFLMCRNCSFNRDSGFDCDKTSQRIFAWHTARLHSLQEENGKLKKDVSEYQRIAYEESRETIKKAEKIDKLQEENARLKEENEALAEGHADLRAQAAKLMEATNV